MNKVFDNVHDSSEVIYCWKVAAVRRGTTSIQSGFEQLGLARAEMTSSFERFELSFERTYVTNLIDHNAVQDCPCSH